MVTINVTETVNSFITETLVIHISNVSKVLGFEIGSHVPQADLKFR